MTEIIGMGDVIGIEYIPAFRIEPWMLIVLLMIFILIREWRIRSMLKNLK